MGASIYQLSGDDGDALFALPTIKALGGGHLRLYPSDLVRRRYHAAKAESLATLLRQQPYIHSVSFITRDEFEATKHLGIVLDDFRYRLPDKLSLIDSIANYHGAKITHDPWLHCPNPIKTDYDIIIHRSKRYWNPLFPYWEILDRFKGKIAQIGTRHDVLFKDIPHLKTKNFAHLAQVISGSQLFIGNQSAPMAVALGLGVNIIQEVCTWCPNCILHRPDSAIYVFNGTEIKYRV